MLSFGISIVQRLISLEISAGTMRTPRSGANKKTPPAKKNAASETVPRTRGGRGGGRRSNPRGAAASVIVDPPSVAASEVDADLIGISAYQIGV